MASPPASLLTYSPPWYRYGDADHPLMALAYGLLAMCTVWVFESLIHNLLFSSDLHISVADAAALFTFKAANWWDICRWSFRGRGLRRNRRAHVAILLRLIVTAIDVFIIVCAVPREFIVYERDIGNPMINFQRRGNPLFRSPNATVLEFNACIWDKTTFDSFTPNAAILVCSTQNAFEGTASPADNASEIAFMVKHNRSMERLEFKSMSDNAVFFITHNLFLPADESRNATTFSLPLPPDVAQQAVRALRNDPKFTRNCGYMAPDKAPTSEPGAYFSCDPRLIRNSNDLREKVIIATMLHIYTQKTDPSRWHFRKVKPGGMEEIDKRGMGAEIGTVNRPIVCIIPGLILFGTLLLLHIIVKFRVGSGNIIMKLYRLTVEAIGDEGNINPLYANYRRLMFQGDKTTYRDFDRSKGGGYLVGNWQNERLPDSYHPSDHGFRDPPTETSDSVSIPTF